MPSKKWQTSRSISSSKEGRSRGKGSGLMDKGKRRRPGTPPQTLALPILSNPVLQRSNSRASSRHASATMATLFHSRALPLQVQLVPAPVARGIFLEHDRDLVPYLSQLPLFLWRRNVFGDSLWPTPQAFHEYYSTVRARRILCHSSKHSRKKFHPAPMLSLIELSMK